MAKYGKGWLGVQAKMWKMSYLGNKMDDCVRIENAVKESGFAPATIQKWLKGTDKWADNYDETGRIS